MYGPITLAIHRQQGAKPYRNLKSRVSSDPGWIIHSSQAERRPRSSVLAKRHPQLWQYWQHSPARCLQARLEKLLNFLDEARNLRVLTPITLNDLPATGTAGLRSDTDVWFKKYEEAKELAGDVLTLIQVSPFAKAGR